MPDPRDGDEHGDERGDEHDDEHDERDERELRVLLERAVPRLPAAEGRMRRVRERVVRTRRRRRVAGGAALTVTGLVLAGTLVPGLPGFAGAGGDRERAAGTGTDVASPAFPAVPATTPAPGPSPTSLNTVTFTELGGLTLRLPGGWTSLELPADPVDKADPLGFVSSTPFSAFDPDCVKEEGQQCPPLGTLSKGEALLILTPMSAQGLGSKIQHPPSLESAGPPSGLCRKLLGTTEYVGMMDGHDSPYTAITATLCVSGAASEAVTDIGAALAGAGFDTTGATPAPHPTPTNK